jgi:hypothetical protein
MNAVFRPSRQYRRQFAGQPCPGCGNRVDPSDLWAVTGNGRTYYLHEACLRTMAEVATDVVNGAAADSTGPEEETGQESTAAGPSVHDGPSSPEEAL